MVSKRHVIDNICTLHGKVRMDAARDIRWGYTMKNLCASITVAFIAGVFSTSAFTQNLSPAEQLDTRKKVETAVALAELAEAEGDGEGLLVAARMLSNLGKVAKRDNGDNAEPTFYSVGDLAAAAKAMGVDAAKADAVMSHDSAAPNYCYWDYECGTFECGWIYVCQ